MYMSSISSLWSVGWHNCIGSSSILTYVLVSLLSKEPHYPANAKMNALECSILAFVHTSQEVIKTLTTHLHLLGPKSNSVVRFASESRCTRTSSFHEAHGDVTEIDASNLSDSVGTSSKTEDRERNLQEQLLSSRSSSNFKDPENALQISDQSSLPKEPVDLQKLISSVSLPSLLCAAVCTYIALTCLGCFQLHR